MLNADAQAETPRRPLRRRQAGGVPARVAWLLGLAVATATLPCARAQPLVAVLDLGRAGAPGLALRLLERNQPSHLEDPEGWFAWERARIELLAEWRQWPRGLTRLQQFPAELPPGMQRWARARAAWFHLSAANASAARGVLRSLLWQDAGKVDAAEVRAWRQLVVRSYLVEKRYGDALTAMQRYRLDYVDEQPGWRLLQARVLLSAGHSAGLADLLEGLDSADAEALRLLARLRVDPAAAGDLYAEARKRAETAGAVRERALFWALAARAAEGMNSSARLALALDQGMRHAWALGPEDELYAPQADQAWAAYLRFGRLVGNTVQLLLGNDAAWLDEAEKSLPLTPVRARALLSVLAFEGAAPEARNQAHARFAELLADEPGGDRLLEALYLGARRFPELTAVPEAVRYRLADQALNRSDIRLATRIMGTLEQPPEGADAFAWQLRRARVLVMGGRAEQGAQALGKVLAAGYQPSDVELDRVMQVVFDLQSVGAHREAIRLFAQVEKLELTPVRRRELLFWQADSWAALKEHTLAALYYMRSATLDNPQASDPWGQTARYNAAQALGEAGLVDDARRIYRDLLRATGDPDRAAVLRHRLQQLWLRAAARDNVDQD